LSVRQVLGIGRIIGAGAGIVYQHSDMESLFAACAQRLCAAVEKRVTRRDGIMMLVLLGFCHLKKQA
jgi:hypothetical protein